MNRIKELRERKNISMRQAAEELKIPYTTYVGYEKGAREPNSEMLIRLAEYYNVSVDYLIGRGFFEAADNLNKYVNFPMPATVKRPRLGAIVRSDLIMSEENFDGYDDVPEVFGDCDFTLKCEGDSMTGARMNDGDIIFVKQQNTVENGQIAAVLVDGKEKMLKRVYITDESVLLQSENMSYPPKAFIREEMNRVKIIGKAIGFAGIIK